MTLHPDIEAVLRGERRWCVVLGDACAVLPNIPSGGITHTITDPPYEAEAHTTQRRLMSGTRRSTGGGWRDGDLIAAAPLDFAAITEPERASVAAEIARVTSRWAAVFCQVEATEKWRGALTSSGDHRYIRTCIYVKEDPQPQLTGDRPGMGFECFVLTHPTGKPRWNGGGRCGVFYSLSGKDVDRRDGRSVHPAQKPTKLAVELLDLFADPGDLILDCYAGSATFGVAALRRGCRYIGIERDPKYAAVATERLESETHGLSLSAARAGQTSLFDLATVKRPDARGTKVLTGPEESKT